MAEPSTTNLEGSPSPTKVEGTPTPTPAEGEPPEKQGSNMQVPAEDQWNQDQTTQPQGMITGSGRNKVLQDIKNGFRKLWILFWKCFLLRKRSWVLLLFELIFIPLCCICPMLLLQPVQTTGVRRVPGLNSESFTGEALIGKAVKEIGNMVYAPNNAKTKKIIQTLHDKVNRIIFTKGLASEAAVKKEYNKISNMDLDDRNQFQGGVIFTTVNKDKVEYKIRFPIFDGKGGILANTDKMIREDFHAEPNPFKMQSEEDMYPEIFLGLQLLLDESATEVLTGIKPKGNVTLKTFPYPDTFTLGKEGPSIFGSVEPSIILSLLYACVFSNAYLAKNIIGEKDTGVKELLKLSGYPGWMQWMAWYFIPVLQNTLIIIPLILLVIFVPIHAIQTQPEAVGVVSKSDVSLWYFFMVLTLISNASFVFFLASFFKSSSLGTAVIIISTFLLSIISSMLIPYLYNSGFDFSSFMGMAVFPQFCFSMTIMHMLALERLGFGAHWAYFEVTIPGKPYLNLGYLFLMYLVDIIGFFGLAVYIENVLPSDYGIRKPLYYPVQPIIRLIKYLIQRRKKGLMPPIVTVNENTGPEFERHNPTTPAGIVVRDIVKQFGRKIAVDHVSLNMYEGEIFALLGHNGAGKTTLISVLTGLYAATSGTATISGYDIVKEIEDVRNSLGLCPQHNMLFNNLTVMEHLKIFGQIKGKSLKETTEEARELLKFLQFVDKADVLAKKLSGGQKRKLCLGMSLVGGAKVVVLDEPTSGMDPEARRAIWDILLNIRGSRTILLTTHFMEEADVLGDRIAIMAEGKIQCCGSPTFLKSYYGTGYTLKLSLLPGGDKNVIFPVVQKHIPTAVLKPIHMAHEVFITLPLEAATSAALTGMFGALTAKKEELKIESLGLAVSSMDEVFLKVGELASGVPDWEAFKTAKKVESDAQSQAPSSAQAQVQSQAPSTELSQAPEQQSKVLVVQQTPPPFAGQIPVKPRGIRMVLMKMRWQTLAIFLKQVHYTRRRWGLLIFQLIFPALFMMGIALSISYAFSPSTSPIPLKISLDSFSNPVSLYTADTKKNGKIVESAIGSSAKNVDGTLEKILLKQAESDLVVYKKKYIIAGEMNGENYIAWANPSSYHSSSISLNVASNIRSPKNFKITTTNYPLQTDEALLLLQAQVMVVVAQKLGETPPPLAVGMVLIMIFSVMLLPMAAPYIVQPAEENINKSRMLELMTGVNPAIYWAVNILWDYIILLGTVIIAIIIILCCEKYGFFSSNHGLGVFFLMMMGYGGVTIPVAYLLSHSPKTVAGAVTILLVFLFLPYLLINTIMALMKSGPNANLYRMNVIHGMESMLVQYYFILYLNFPCNYIPQDEKSALYQTVCTRSNMRYPALKTCCGRKMCKYLEVKCFKTRGFLSWTIDFMTMPTTPFDKPAITTMPGMGQILLCLFLQTIFFFGFHLFVEFGGFRMIRSLMIKSNLDEFVSSANDDDVMRENERVKEMIHSGQKTLDAFIVDDLCKSFGNFSAVCRVTFGVHYGECFGLLGTNGAGKTTTFRMIIGDELRSYGDAFEGNIALSMDRTEFLSNIGYCPQFDAFVPHLSGKENLLIFALLRGFPWGQANQEAQKWLVKVGLEQDGHVKVKNYSGGMKRRLSAALAMIGDPTLVLLDEPTSGVDPVSRRQFWKVLESVRGSGRQAIILTSHSMDECEVLCSRLGIMVNGELQCLGGVQHLKHKFAQGFTLTVRLKPQLSPEQVQYGQQILPYLNNEICQKFEPCHLKEQHEAVLNYQISNTNLGWNVLYSTLEELKKKYEQILEDYSVNETTLEEVFLSLAKKQYGLRESSSPCWKRCLTCQC